MMTEKGFIEVLGLLGLKVLRVLGYSAVIVLAVYGFAVLCALIGGYLSMDVLVQ